MISSSMKLNLLKKLKSVKKHSRINRLFFQKNKKKNKIQLIVELLSNPKINEIKFSIILIKLMKYFPNNGNIIA